MLRLVAAAVRHAGHGFDPEIDVVIRAVIRDGGGNGVDLDSVVTVSLRAVAFDQRADRSRVTDRAGDVAHEDSVGAVRPNPVFHYVGVSGHADLDSVRCVAEDRVLRDPVVRGDPSEDLVAAGDAGSSVVEDPVPLDQVADGAAFDCDAVGSVPADRVADDVERFGVLEEDARFAGTRYDVGRDQAV